MTVDSFSTKRLQQRVFELEEFVSDLMTRMEHLEDVIEYREFRKYQEGFVPPFFPG